MPRSHKKIYNLINWYIPNQNILNSEVIYILSIAQMGQDYVYFMYLLLNRKL